MKHRAESRGAAGALDGPAAPTGGARAVRDLLKSVFRMPRMLRLPLMLATLVLVFVCVFSARWSWDSIARVGGMPSADSTEAPPLEYDPAFRNIDESVLPPIVVKREDQVCALCTDGLVYVHVGRPAHATETVSAAPVQHTVTEVMHVRPDDAPTFSAGSGLPTAAWPKSSEVVRRCLAQLISLGQLGAAQDETVVYNGTDPRVSAAVLVDYDAAGAGTLVGRADRCPAFVTEVRPAAAAAASTASAARMTVSYPRLPSWPLRSAGCGGVCGPVPRYFGTAKVRETDVDKDVQPPVSVELTGDGSGVVVRFGRDESSTKPAPFEMVCPSHFVSAFIGRFGRQHNQVEEIIHTLALSRKVNRTFIVPILMPESYTPYLRYDAQRAYGFNALRREGGYCLVTYAEARRMLKRLEALGEPMSLRRFSYYADPRPNDAKGFETVRNGDWWELPDRSANGTAWLNMDAWLEDSKAREPPVTTVRDTRADGMNFVETEEDFTVKDAFPEGGEHRYVRMARMRIALRKVADLLCGDHRSVDGAKRQPRLAMFSARMAFYMRPSLREQTLLMGLLRPADAIVKEADRVYAQNAARLSWPRTGTEFRDTLRTGNFKQVIGIHIRHREGTCRYEGVHIDQTTYPIDPRFELDNADPSWSGPLSTLRHMELDCALTKTRVVELYRQYTRWMRHNMTEKRTAPAQLVPTMYMAYDDQSGPIAEQVDRRLVSMARGSQRRLTWGNAREYPEGFVASYDTRIDGDFWTLFKKTEELVNKEYERKRGNAALERQRRVDLVRALYDPALTEILAMAFDYFMLTNMGMFRGATLSSVSTNVVMRRWGRGLPCHGVLPGYLVSFYTAMWF